MFPYSEILIARVERVSAPAAGGRTPSWTCDPTRATVHRKRPRADAKSVPLAADGEAIFSRKMPDSQEFAPRLPWRPRGERLA
mmetsp:Transcript_107821/g.310561  ORF Transcript_107821/g.310561 Transcript_107821/m.310561 type:complete len:83 (-) Transcript_107821:393-641(-)